MPFLGQMVALFVVSVLIAYLCHRIRLVPIVGYLIAGVLIGPGALGLVSDRVLIDNLAEIGVVLLLFTIGVDFSLSKLMRIRHVIVRGGFLQGFIVIGTVAVVLLPFGVDWRTGIFTGFLVVLSSTVIVLKLLADSGETDSPAGQVTLALLIFQDLAMVVMVLFVPMLSGDRGSFIDLVIVLLKATLILAFVLLLARRAIPWLLDKVARTRANELFLLTVVLICFGTAWVTSLAGVSLALGAFLAGLVVSESRYSGYALTEILPLRTIFNAIFFVSIGMLLNLGFLIENLALVFGVALLVFALKALTTVGAILFLGYPMRIAAVSGLALAQICESSFVLERAGAAVGLSPAGLGDAGQQIFIAVAVVLMVATPFMLKYGPSLGEYLEDRGIGPRGRKRAEDEIIETELEDHVIVVGFGPIGRRIVEVLQGIGIPYVIVELNPETVRSIEAAGHPVIYGDASRTNILELAGIERAKLCAAVINDRDAARRIVERAHFMNPSTRILVRVRFLNEVRDLEEVGANVVVPEELEASIRILSSVLNAYQVPEHVLHAQSSAIRQDDDAAMAAAIEPVREAMGQTVETLRTRSLTVREDAIAAGLTLEELGLEAYGLYVRAIERETDIMSPEGHIRLQPRDEIIAVGSAASFAAASHLFRRGSRST